MSTYAKIAAYVLAGLMAEALQSTAPPAIFGTPTTCKATHCTTGCSHRPSTIWLMLVT